MVSRDKGYELGLDQWAETRPNLRYDAQGAFRVEIAAEPLEVRTEQEQVAAQVLINQVRLRRCEQE
jgi:hypothetical protein